MQQLQHDGALDADVGLRNELLRLQLVGTLLRLAMWQSQHAVSEVHAGAEQANFRRFRNLLDRDFALHHQVQHYASALGMSDKTLSRVCLAALRVPAKTAINQRLVLEAKRLLAHTSMACRLLAESWALKRPLISSSSFAKKLKCLPWSFALHSLGRERSEGGWPQIGWTHRDLPAEKIGCESTQKRIPYLSLCV